MSKRRPITAAWDRAIVGVEPFDPFVDRAANRRGQFDRTISRTARGERAPQQLFEKKGIPFGDPCDLATRIG